MPTERDEQRFRRELENSSELDYIRKMKYFYDSTLQELSKQLGQETEFDIKVTDAMLEKIEERLSEFEEKEREIIKRYEKFARELVF